MEPSCLDASGTIPEMSQTMDNGNLIVSAQQDNIIPATINKHKCDNKATLVFVIVLVLGFLLPIFGYVFASYLIIKIGAFAAGIILIVVASVAYYYVKEVRKRSDQQTNATYNRSLQREGRINETVDIELNDVVRSNMSLFITRNNATSLSSLLSTRNNDNLQEFPMTVQHHEEENVTICEDTPPPAYESIVGGKSPLMTTPSNSNIQL